MTDKPILVLWHKGASYIPCGYGAAVYRGSSQAYINGIPVGKLDKAPGSDSYYAIKGRVESIELRLHPLKVIVSYEAVGNLGIKSPISTAEYEDLPEASREALYRAVCRDEPKSPVPLPFEVIDADAPPVKLPDGVKILAPDILRLVPSLWHTLPCHLEVSALMKRLAAAIQSEAKDKRQFEVNYYENLGRLSVIARFWVKGLNIDFRQTIIEISSEPRSGYVTLPTITGKNLANLEATVSKWIDGNLEKMRVFHTPAVCPCCGVKTKRGSDLILPGRPR